MILNDAPVDRLLCTQALQKPGDYVSHFGQEAFEVFWRSILGQACLKDLTQVFRDGLKFATRRLECDIQ